MANDNVDLEDEDEDEEVGPGFSSTSMWAVMSILTGRE